METGDYSRGAVVFGGSGLNSREISIDIARSLGVSHAELEIREFPDGEIYVKVPVNGVTGKHVIYVQSTAPHKSGSKEVSQSQSLMELFLTLDAMTEKKAKIVDVVVPYFAHARQDKEFYPGEIVSTRTIGKILKSLCIHQVFTVDVHAYRKTGAFPFGKSDDFAGIEGHNITAAKALASYVKNNLRMESPIVIIPDKGHAPIAEKIRSVLLPEDTVVLHKRRISGEIVEMDRIEVSDIEDRDVVIFDDMISTGGTIVKAAGRVKEKGARNIVVAVTHALYLSGARERILRAGVSRIVTTDTIPNEDSVVPIAPVIAESLKEIIC